MDRIIDAGIIKITRRRRRERRAVLCEMQNDSNYIRAYDNVRIGLNDMCVNGRGERR